MPKQTMIACLAVYALNINSVFAEQDLMQVNKENSIIKKVANSADKPISDSSATRVMNNDDDVMKQGYQKNSMRQSDPVVNNTQESGQVGHKEKISSDSEKQEITKDKKQSKTKNDNVSEEATGAIDVQPETVGLINRLIAYFSK